MRGAINFTPVSKPQYIPGPSAKALDRSDRLVRSFPRRLISEASVL